VLTHLTERATLLVGPTVDLCIDDVKGAVTKPVARLLLSAVLATAVGATAPATISAQSEQVDGLANQAIAVAGTVFCYSWPIVGPSPAGAGFLR